MTVAAAMAPACSNNSDRLGSGVQKLPKARTPFSDGQPLHPGITSLGNTAGRCVRVSLKGFVRDP